MDKVKELRLKAKSLQKQLTKDNKEIFNLIESLFVLFEDLDNQVQRHEEKIYNKE